MPSPDQYRADLDIVVGQSATDLEVAFRDVTTIDEANDVLLDELPGMIAFYGSAAGTLAADWYDDTRAELGVGGGFRSIVAELPDVGRAAALAGWATALTKAGTPTADAVMAKAQGGLQLAVADQGRKTMMGSALADPQARGWQRSASGGCPFCVMLAGRGAVYSRSTVDFGAHDHCKCVAVPAFEGVPLLVQPYTPTDRRISDADRARVNAWIAQHAA